MQLLEVRYDQENVNAGPAPRELARAAMRLVETGAIDRRTQRHTTRFEGPPTPDFDQPGCAIFSGFRPFLTVSSRPRAELSLWTFEDGFADNHTLALMLHPKPDRDPWDWRDELAAGDFDVSAIRWEPGPDMWTCGSGPHPASDAEMALLIAAAHHVAEVAERPAAARVVGGREARKLRKARTARARQRGRNRKLVRKAISLLPFLTTSADCLALATDMLRLFRERDGVTDASPNALAAVAVWLSEPGQLLAEVADFAATDLLDALTAQSDLHDALWLPGKDPLSRRVAQCFRDQQERVDMLPPV